MTGRKIVVDGVEYRWKTGIGMTEVRLDGKVFARVSTPTLLGLTPFEHERAIHKRTLNCAVTPGLVEQFIRCKLPK